MLEEEGRAADWRRAGELGSGCGGFEGRAVQPLCVTVAARMCLALGRDLGWGVNLRVDSFGVVSVVTR